ncbi:uncharacterized protein LOC122502083 [Leptopilina heterotoma]|uniref:uncharacterized protein LOC122502083 n=1 Tax=Leptopilina heterotoma TaxID=63436 RepID=UPI001CA8E5FF|nr:uncharacterized protein LOC122502083 [Leptopilina heterotoma]XP_043467903.1 uncharacterized protein LOC122502083 [Leptopilina heterotoma]XP_043467904.1 uncharacterized protein LOC122502083 [Leptopilina heterotoma]
MNLRISAIFFLIFSSFTIIYCKEYIESLEYREFQEFKEFEEFKQWKREKKLSEYRENENKSDEKKNDQGLLGKEFIKVNDNSNEENSSNEKQKWKDKNWKEYKNKNYKKKNYKKSDNSEEGETRSNELENKDQRKKYQEQNYEQRKKKNNGKYKNFDKANFERIEYEKTDNNNDDPPPINEAALMARYIVNQANWTSVATISSRKDIRSFPSANVISFGDGILGNGSGIPYMYLTPLDFTAQDIHKDNRASLMMTLAQGRYCKTKNYDPMDPRCARVILTGKIRPVNLNSTEMQIAEKAVFNRHPWLQNMPADHHFFFAKLKIASIAMLDTFGGPKFVPVKDYLHPPTPNITAEFSRLNSQESKNDIYEEFESNNPNVILV